MGHAVVLAVIAHRIDLVLHKRNQRGDDYGRTLAHKRGQLVAKRLASARRHKHEDIVAVDKLGNDLFLVPFEFFKPEVFLQGSSDCYSVGHKS